MTATRTLTAILATASFALVAAVVLGVLKPASDAQSIAQRRASIYDQLDRVSHNRDVLLAFTVEKDGHFIVK